MDMNLTEIIFLLDRSGSMAGFESDTIGGFNAFVKKQGELKGRTLVTTVLFDDKYELLWNGIDSNKAVLTTKEYYTRGRTALLDAVGKTILDVGCRLSTTFENEKPGKVIFVITTDGLENASLEFTHDKVRKLIEHQKEKYNWEFIFLGANIDAAAEAGNIGICRDKAYSFEASKEGLGRMYAMVSDVVTDFRNAKE